MWRTTGGEDAGPHRAPSPIRSALPHASVRAQRLNLETTMSNTTLNRRIAVASIVGLGSGLGLAMGPACEASREPGADTDPLLPDTGISDSGRADTDKIPQVSESLSASSTTASGDESKGTGPQTV